MVFRDIDMLFEKRAKTKNMFLGNGKCDVDKELIVFINLIKLLYF